GPVLRSLAESLHLERPTLTLLDPAHDVLRIEAAHGLTPSEIGRGVYAVGEGVTGEVAESGVAAVVERITDAPRFVDRTGALASGDRSFVCVPVRAAGKAIGTLSAYRPVRALDALQQDARLLSVVASLLTPATRLA